jgi:hypothetical protein
MNVEIGTEAAQFLFGNICFEFRYFVFAVWGRVVNLFFTVYAPMMRCRHCRFSRSFGGKMVCLFIEIYWGVCDTVLKYVREYNEDFSNNRCFSQMLTP